MFFWRCRWIGCGRSIDRTLDSVTSRSNPREANRFERWLHQLSLQDQLRTWLQITRNIPSQYHLFQIKTLYLLVAWPYQSSPATQVSRVRFLVGALSHGLFNVWSVVVFFWRGEEATNFDRTKSCRFATEFWTPSPLSGSATRSLLSGSFNPRFHNAFRFCRIS